MFFAVSVKVIAYIANWTLRIKTPAGRSDGTFDPKLPRDYQANHEELRGKCRRVSHGRTRSPLRFRPTSALVAISS